MKKKIAVFHPGLQHSYQLAWALYERDLLEIFCSGVPVKKEGEPIAAWLPSSYSAKVKLTPIPSNLRFNWILFPLLRIIVAKTIRRKSAKADLERRVDQLFDWMVSFYVSITRPKMVVAYENAAYHTFKSAKRIGAICVLDAAAVHHSTAASLFAVENTPHLVETNRRLDCEIQLADIVLTCSPLAAKSYIDNGVPSEKVTVALLGAHLPDAPTLDRKEGPVRFLFAGVLSHRKSVDLIIEAFRRLHDEGEQFQLTFVGGEGEFGWIEQIKKYEYFDYLPSLPQLSVFDMMRSVDCLLLPSRADSFGMVVTEAIACGTPVIVSNQVGAAVIVEQFPRVGWIVQPTAVDVYECVKDRLHDKAALLEARLYTPEAAQKYTWESYRNRVGSLLSEIYNNKP